MMEFHVEVRLKVKSKMTGFGEVEKYFLRLSLNSLNHIGVIINFAIDI
jgi:hypothetical protein